MGVKTTLFQTQNFRKKTFLFAIKLNKKTVNKKWSAVVDKIIGESQKTELSVEVLNETVSRTVRVVFA